MKAVTKNNWSTLVLWNRWYQDQKLRRLLSVCIYLRNYMPSKVQLVKWVKIRYGKNKQDPKCSILGPQNLGVGSVASRSTYAISHQMKVISSHYCTLEILNWLQEIT